MNRPLCVLIVEDLPLSVALVRQALDEDGAIKSEFVHTLDDALKRLETKGIDAVLLDLGLPDADGVTAVRTLMAQRPEVPIVVLSGNAAEYAAALQSGAHEFLVKPASGPAIAKALRDAVVRHQVRAVFQPMRELHKQEEDIIRQMRELPGKVAADPPGGGKKGGGS